MAPRPGLGLSDRVVIVLPLRDHKADGHTHDMVEAASLILRR